VGWNEKDRTYCDVCSAELNKGLIDRTSGGKRSRGHSGVDAANGVIPRMKKEEK